MKLLEFIFSSVWHFFGSCILIVLIIGLTETLFSGIAEVIKSFRR